MTYKTDFKFGLLILAILAGTFLFATRAIRSDRLIASDVEAKLHRNMTRPEVESIFRGHRGAHVVGGNASSIIYSLQNANGERTNTYHFNFDPHGRLASVFVDDEYAPGHFTNRAVALQ